MTYQQSTPRVRGGAGLDAHDFAQLPAPEQRAALAGLGLHIFPVRTDADGPKRPYTGHEHGGRWAGGHWPEQATTDPDVAVHHWPAGAGVGIACGPSGLLVVDVDRKPGKPDGMAELEKVWQHGTPWGCTPSVATPTNGYHLYFRDPSGTVKSSADRFAPSVDIRAAGGYVVAPGTTLHNGTTYRPLHWPGTFPDAPQWLVDALVALAAPKPVRTSYTPPTVDGAAAQRTLSGVLRTVADAEGGNRNNALNWGAYRLAEKGLLTAEHAAELHKAARAAGLDDAEIRRTIESAARATGVAR